MGNNVRILQHLRSGDHASVRAALEELRERGGLAGGALRKVNLDGALLRAANFDLADLTWATLIGADMTGASLRGAILENAALAGADLSGADFAGANLRHAILEDANLDEAEITEEQLVQADRLAGATLPDGSRYDGRYNLAGDLDTARRMGVEVEDIEQMAAFYEVERSNYERGQKWAQANLEKLLAERE